MKRKLCFLLFFLLIGLFLCKKEVCGSYYIDEFNEKDTNYWVFSDNLGHIDIGNSGLILSSNSWSFPFIYNNPDSLIIPQEEDFNLKISFKFNNIDFMGDGVGVGFFKGERGDTLIEFGIWADSNLGFIFMKNDFSLQGNCLSIDDFKDNDGRSNIPLTNMDPYTWHTLEVERLNKTLSFFIDRSINPIPLHIIKDLGCIGRNIFIGNKYTGGSRTWTSLSIDYVSVNTETVPSTKPKVVVIPGLGASWNSLGVLGVSDPALKWKIPAFVNVYDNLINTFIGNGYQLNKDLFVWGYDWRPSIAQISTTFDSFIQETMVEDDEIILIGHSLGGLVARWWYQDHGNDSRIKKVISLGSPHWGAVDAYQAWNGGSVDGRGWSSVLFNLLILLNRDLTETNISVVQRVAPVVSDLQPTFDFAYRNNQLLPYTSMVNYNSSLDAKNSQFNGSPLVNLETIIGTGFATNQFINLGPRSFFDQRLGLWPDGRPMLLGKTNYGDGTVLSASSRLGQKYWELNSGHGELPTLAINHIMSVLGLGETSLTSNDNFSDKLIFYIASPAYLKINCGQADILSDEMGFVVVSRNDINGQCSLEVIPIGAGGDYKLLVSNTTNGDWLKIKGRVTDQNDNYSFDQNGNLNNQDNIFAIFKKYCQRLLDTYPSQADLVNCLNWAEKKQADEMVDSLFSFRSKTRQIDISWEMIDRIIPFLNNKSVNQQQALWYWKNGQDMLNLVEKMANLKQDRNVITDDFGVASYDLATRIFEQATNDLELGQLNDVYSRFSLAKRILEQVW